ncbi:hypothetical protein LUZ60_005692 [Juncus effusus]|nr:hypothetical protein LUZ60_005692 [Juncus effusus]
MSPKPSFQLFLQSWLVELNSIVDRLERLSLDPLHERQHEELVSLFMEHQESLFSARGELVSFDPFLSVGIPRKLNSLVGALEWYGGWRPVAAYGVANGCCVVPLEQEAKLKAMRLITKSEEVAVEREKSRTETIIIKAFVNGKGLESMEKPLKKTMEKVALAADRARMEAVKRVVAMLPPAKAVVYLAELGKMEADFYGMNVVQV